MRRKGAYCVLLPRTCFGSCSVVDVCCYDMCRVIETAYNSSRGSLETDPDAAKSASTTVE